LILLAVHVTDDANWLKAHQPHEGCYSVVDTIHVWQTYPMTDCNCAIVAVEYSHLKVVECNQSIMITWRADYNVENCY